MAGALTAVDVQDFAGHEAGLFEIKDRIDDILDLTHVADRVQGAERRVRLGGMHRRLDDAGRDRVHADAALGVFDRERPGGGVQAATRAYFAPLK